MPSESHPRPFHQAYRPAIAAPHFNHRDFIPLGRLGSGSHGSVSRAAVSANLTMDGGLPLTVAVKAIPREREIFADREIRSNTAMTSHPNIASCFGSFSTEHHIHIVMEFINGGSVRELISSGQEVPELHALKIALQVARGLQHMHEHCISHADIKPDNIILHLTPAGQTSWSSSDDFGAVNKDDVLAKIVDLGISNSFDKEIPSWDGRIRRGTLRYSAPEVILDWKYDPRLADVFSLGVVLYELLYDELPYEFEHHLNADEKYNGKEVWIHRATGMSSMKLFLHSNARVSSDTETLLKKVLSRNYLKRPSMPELVFMLEKLVDSKVLL